MAKWWLQGRYDELSMAVLDWYLSGDDFTEETQLLFDKLQYVRKRLYGKEAA